MADRVCVRLFRVEEKAQEKKRGGGGSSYEFRSVFWLLVSF